MTSDKNIDITKNIKAIESVKSELLEKLALLYKVMSDNKEDVQEQAALHLCDILLKSYVLGKRLGISFQTLDSELENKLRIGILKEEPAEKDFGDFSELLHYLKSKKA